MTPTPEAVNEVAIGGLTFELMKEGYYWVTNEEGEGMSMSKEQIHLEMNKMFNRLF